MSMYDVILLKKTHRFRVIVAFLLRLFFVYIRRRSCLVVSEISFSLIERIGLRSALIDVISDRAQYRR